VGVARHYNAALHAAFEPILDRDRRLAWRHVASGPGRRCSLPTQIGQAAAAAGEPRSKPAADDGHIDVTSDQATLGVDGNATLQGNVVVRQGEREIRANEVQYDAHNTSVSTAGHIDYSDPLVHVTGTGGHYSAAAGAEFKSAEFALRQRAARGAAHEMTLTPQGVIRLRGVMFTTCRRTIPPGS